MSATIREHQGVFVVEHAGAVIGFARTRKIAKNIKSSADKGIAATTAPADQKSHRVRSN